MTTDSYRYYFNMFAASMQIHPTLKSHIALLVLH